MAARAASPEEPISIPRPSPRSTTASIAGDIARAEECQQRISTVSQRVFKFGNPNTIIKKAVNLLGYPVGECRRPFNYLCDEGVAELKAVLKENEELGLC